MAAAGGAARACALVLAAALAGGAAVAAPGAPQPVRSLHYGDGLFRFFQEEHFEALTGLMASQHFGRLDPQAAEAELLRGGLLLSYGLHQSAGEIFERLIDTGATESVRDRAWYLLAKLRYQRGLHPEAEAALARIGKTLPRDQAIDAVLIGAQIALAQGDAARASRLLEGLTGLTGEESETALVARFNLGVALVRAGESERGHAVLDALGRAPAPDEGTQALRDKANLALGYSELQAGRPLQARAVLERVRLQGMSSNKALLGFGWAADALKQPLDALVPWTELLNRDTNDAAILEARLAVPYALAALGARGQSAQMYREALDVYERENASLDQSIAAIRTGGLVRALMERNPSEDMGWFASIRELPDMPHASHLAPVMARNDFQEGFKNLRDLLHLERNLATWQERLEVFDAMLDTRRQAYAERLPRVLDDRGRKALDALQERQQALGGELDTAESTQDGAALADARQRGQLQRIERARRTLEAAPGEPDQTSTLADARERLRRVAGALTWDLDQALPERLWRARRAHQDGGTALAEAGRRLDVLEAARITEPQRFDAFAARIAGLQGQLARLLPGVGALAAEQGTVLQDIAVAELVAQKERLAGYTSQARFALAQLLDQAAQASQPAGRGGRPNATP